MDAPIVYEVRAWVSPAGGERYLAWLAIPEGSAVEVSEMAGGKFTWKWTGSTPASIQDFGTPETSTEYTVCVVDLSGGTPTLVSSTSVPTGSAGWTRSLTRVQYEDVLAGPGQISKLALKAGAAGKIAAKGRGVPLVQGRLPLVTPVKVVLKRKDAPSAWGATFSTPKQNKLERFKAKSD